MLLFNISWKDVIYSEDIKGPKREELRSKAANPRPKLKEPRHSKPLTAGAICASTQHQLHNAMSDCCRVVYPPAVHLCCKLQFAYLKSHPNMGCIEFDLIDPSVNMSVFNNNADWTDFDRDVKEKLLPKMPELLGKLVSIYLYFMLIIQAMS